RVDTIGELGGDVQSKAHNLTSLRKKSTFFPKGCKTKSMDAFEELVMREVERIKRIDKNRMNLNKEEQQALADLRENKEVVIKPADKGGGIVLMDREYYIEESLRQLNDGITYKKLK
ncbi:Hypothetical predicted protein, partial [Pelobates cultripes]